MSLLKQSVLPFFKMIINHDFSLTILSMVSSIGFIGYANYLDIIIKGTDPKNIVLPILVEVFGIIMFTIFSILHTLTGLQAAKYEYKLKNNTKKAPISSWFDNDKIWKMYWKTLGVVFFTTLIMLLTLFTEIIGYKNLYIASLWLQVTLLFLACGFEFQSIGNNLTRIGKDKYEIFILVDKLINLVQTRFTEKIKKSINNKK